jgi:hypothetical protein
LGRTCTPVIAVHGGARAWPLEREPVASLSAKFLKEIQSKIANALRAHQKNRCLEKNITESMGVL